MGRVRRLVPRERIEGRILQFRRDKVMLDSDLAKLYGVPTRRLNEQVRRNRDRFLDFPFATGADGTKLLRANDNLVGPQFLYYALLHQAIQAAGTADTSST